MADTQRTLAALLAILADNTAGDISEQDLRDLLVSVFGGYGGIYLTSAADAQDVDIAPVKITAFDTNMVSSGVTSDHTDDSITIGTTGVYYVEFTVAFSGSSGEVFTIQLYKAGVAVAGAFLKRKLTGAGDIASASFALYVSCNAADELDVRVNSEADSKTVTIESGLFSVSRIE